MLSRVRTAAGAVWLGVALLWAGPGLAQPADEEAAERLMQQARRFVQQDNVEDALDEYRVLVNEFPKSRLAPVALLQAAQLRLGRGEAELAFTTAQQLIDSYGRDPSAAAAWVLQGEVRSTQASNLAELKDAGDFFRRVPLLFLPETYPRLDARIRGLVRGGEVSILVGALDEAAAAFLEAIENEPPSPWKARARLGLAAVWLWQGNWVAAAEELQRVVSTGAGSSDPVAAQAAEAARRRLTLIHRLYIRPQASQRSWQRAREWTQPGLVMKRPAGVASGQDGRILVADGGSDTCAVLLPDGTIQGRSNYRSPSRPWFGWLGGPQLIVPDGVQQLGGRLVAFEIAGEKPKPLKKIQAAAIGIFENWIVVDREVGGLASFDRNGRFQGVSFVSELPQIEDIAIDARGQLYVLDGKERRVTVLGADMTPLRRFSGAWRRPAALDVDDLGNVYVLDRNERTISIYDTVGNPVTSLGPTLDGGIELRAPEDLAVDPTGRIFVADGRLASLVVVE